MWTNVIHNALQAMSYCGVLSIAVTRSEHHAMVDITDNGVGIPIAMQSQIFDPFFTTKSMGEGSGLELSIVQKIIEKH